MITGRQPGTTEVVCTALNEFERVTKLLLTLLLTVQEKLAFDLLILAEKPSVHDDGTLILQWEGVGDHFLINHGHGRPRC